MTELNHNAETTGRIEDLSGIAFPFRAAAFSLGFSSLITQIVILREFLTIFSGNEMIIGILLANWMLLTGTGAWFGKYACRSFRVFPFLILSLMLMAVLPVALVLLMNYLKNIVFVPGIMLSLMPALWGSLILLAPYCLLSGVAFTFLSCELSEKYYGNFISRVYSIESAGSLAGGLLFNFILIYYLTVFQSLAIVMALNFFAALLCAFYLERKIYVFTTALIALIFLLLTLFTGLGHLKKSWTFRGQEIVYDKDTPFGNITVTYSGDQYNFFENHVLLFAGHNDISNEETVHYGMLQLNRPETVLLISGGISGTTQEILKYGVNRVDYIEMNPSLIEAGKQFTRSLENKKIRVITSDARIFIRQTVAKYDAVILDLAGPNTTRYNGFYTLEFFSDLKNRMTDSGMVSVSWLDASAYVSGEANKLNSSLYVTLKEVFDHVLIVPGEKYFFLASSRPLDINISKLSEKKKIENVYVNSYYIDDKSLSERSQSVRSVIDVNAEVNRDFQPVSYYLHFQYWLSYFNADGSRSNLLLYVVMACLILYLILLFRMHPVNFSLFTGGFTASSVQIILLFSFQIIYGYVYHVAGIIITLFMAGLFAGSRFRYRILKKPCFRNFAGLQAAAGLFAGILPVVLFALPQVRNYTAFLHLLFFLLTLIIALLTGMQFSLATVMKKKNVSETAGEMYGADLFGSAAGALLTAAFLIPALGLMNACILTGLLNIFSVIRLAAKRNIL